MKWLLTRLVFVVLLTCRNVSSDAATLTATIVRPPDDSPAGYAVLGCPDVPEYCPPGDGSRWQVLAIMVPATACRPELPCTLTGNVPTVIGHWTFYAVAVGSAVSAPSNVWTW